MNQCGFAVDCGDFGGWRSSSPSGESQPIFLQSMVNRSQITNS